MVSAQEKSDLHKRAEAADPKEHIATARSLYIHAFNDYYNRGQMKLGVECATKAASLYYSRENYYKEAFDLLRRADDAINSSQKDSQAEKAAMHYLVTKERLNMYIKLRKSDSAKDQLNIMESQANQSGDENVKNDLLYTKAIYYYTFGMNAQGNAVFKEMADKLTASKEYDKVDEVYQTLISNGRKSNNANMVAQSYSNYIAWKDSTSAIKHADEIAALKKQIADNEATIADKDSSLSTRWFFIIGLCILAAALAAALVIGGIVLMRFILLDRKQKKTIRLANESNALKAKFISNISAQLQPTFKKLDSKQPEVKALLDFSEHLLTNAAEYTPAGGSISLDFKKRGPHSYQFLVSDTGSGIPEEKREDIFKPFLEIRDLTTGDGLGLPICKQMALKMNGDLDIDPKFTKGTRFVLDLHA